MSSEAESGGGVEGTSRSSELVVQDGRLYHLGVRPEEVSPNLIVVGDPARAYKVAAHFDTLEHEIKEREFVTLTGRYKEHRLTVIGTGIGTDNVEIALIEWNAALCFDLESAMLRDDVPKRQVTRVGTSGGAQPDIAAGTLAVAEFALGLDSTGVYYDAAPNHDLVPEIESRATELLAANLAPNARFANHLEPYAAAASAKLHADLLSKARSLDSRVISGITASTSSFYGASSRYIEGLRNTVPDIKGTLAQLEVDGRRVVNFEMESSLLFHLGAALGVDCCTICPVISQPQSHDAVIDYAPRIERAIEVALQTLVERAG